MEFTLYSHSTPLHALPITRCLILLRHQKKDSMIDSVSEESTKVLTIS